MSNRMKLFLLTASLAGALFSLANAGGAHLLCRTEGCRIYAGYGLFGISFYIFGAAGFLAIFVLALLHPRRATGALLYLALLTALALDTIFLAYQALFWPCSSCLAVALLLGLIGLTGVVHFTSGRKLLLAVGSLWLVLFLFVGLSTAREIGLRPWPLFGPPDASVQVYFSPDCPACRQTVRQLLDSPKTAGLTVFYPIAKNDEDLRRIAAYLARDGRKTADKETFLSLFTDPGTAAAPPLGWRDRLRLLANKAALARTGAHSVPLVIAPFLPAPAPTPLDLTPFTPPDFSPGGGDTPGCSAFEEKPCD